MNLERIVGVISWKVHSHGNNKTLDHEKSRLSVNERGRGLDINKQSLLRNPKVFCRRSLNPMPEILLTIYLPQFLSELETNWKYNLGLCQKKIIFHIFFLIWEKLWSPSRATFKNSKIFFWIRKNLVVQPKPRSINFKKLSRDFSSVWGNFIISVHMTSSANFTLSTFTWDPKWTQTGLEPQGTLKCCSV